MGPDSYGLPSFCLLRGTAHNEIISNLSVVPCTHEREQSVCGLRSYYPAGYYPDLLTAGTILYSYKRAFKDGYPQVSLDSPCDCFKAMKQYIFNCAQ